MTEEELEARLMKEPFSPFRLHLVTGKQVDVVASSAAHLLPDAMLVMRNPTIGKSKAGGYDVVAFHYVERIEQLTPGNRPTGKCE